MWLSIWLGPQSCHPENGQLFPVSPLPGKPFSTFKSCSMVSCLESCYPLNKELGCYDAFVFLLLRYKYIY